MKYKNRWLLSVSIEENVVFSSLLTQIKTTYVTVYSYGINFQWIVTPLNFANN